MSETLFDIQYKKLVNTILEQGKIVESRNGKTLQIPYYSFTIENNDLPLYSNECSLTMRKMFYNGVRGEFKTLIDPTPLTNVSQFEANGCNYWRPWAAEDGSINVDYHNMLHPRLEQLLNDIKKDPFSRRHLINLWNQEHVDSGELSLPCCWYSMQFIVMPRGELHMVWNQRSVDVAVGLPSDVMLARYFLQYVADRTELKPMSLHFNLANVHIYSEHLTQIVDMLQSPDSSKVIKFKIKE